MYGVRILREQYEANNQNRSPGPSGVILEELVGDSPTTPPELHAASPVTSYSNAMATTAAETTSPSFPELFTSFPPIRDTLSTQSSQIQDKTIEECLPFLSGQEPGLKYNRNGIPHLDRHRHIQFLHKSLRKLPAPYVAADASRPWMFYWALCGLSTLGEDVSEYRERLINTIRPIQNTSGGFGGGNGQMSHLAPTYAVVLSLAIVGGEEALDLIDRKAMWKWLGALKQPDGGFQMAVGGEEDIRGAYIAAVVISLLDLPLELPQTSPAWSPGATFLSNLPEWIKSCQTFEGGIGTRPDAEAHGAYAFCALACLCILGDPHIIIPECLDVPLLYSWLSARQYAPEGGFSGRTNKLVDGCYSHWVGGCWPLLEACLEGPTEIGSTSGSPSVKSLYSREGLIRYILCCCQDLGKRGGLRDKPSHSSDSYHTCYVLTGLSSAQHKLHFDPSILAETAPLGNLASPYRWAVEPIVEETQVYDEEDRVKTVHPIFVVPEGVAERTRTYYASKGGF
ncbi:hypothetical protein B7463_g4703, partial [Scytalidium lignicola]